MILTTWTSNSKISAKYREITSKYWKKFTPTLTYLREANAVGADVIAYFFIRDSLRAMAYYLTGANNTTLVTDVFPSLCKRGIITPVFKSKQDEDGQR